MTGIGFPLSVKLARSTVRRFQDGWLPVISIWSLSCIAPDTIASTER